jgi:hypothetical protein
MTLMSRTNETNRGASLLRMFKYAGMACAVAFLVSGTIARAGDDDDEEKLPEKSFEQKLISDFFHGIGGQSADDSGKGIDYRERSPLVVPSKIDLPPPMTKKTPAAANWPKDPDLQARRAAIEESKQPGTTWDDAKRPLLPSELAARPSKKKTVSSSVEDDRPGIDNSKSYILSPSQLGFNGGMWSGMLGGKQKEDSKPFVSEPARSSLTEPPSGYQTPSPNYAYGTGPAKSATPDAYNPTLNKGDPNSVR